MTAVNLPAYEPFNKKPRPPVPSLRLLFWESTVGLQPGMRALPAAGSFQRVVEARPQHRTGQSVHRHPPANWQAHPRVLRGRTSQTSRHF